MPFDEFSSYNSSDKKFMELVAGIQLQASPDDLPTVQFDGLPIAIDPIAGAAFRDSLLQCVSEEIVPEGQQFSGEITLSSRAEQTVNNTLAAHLLSPRSIIRPGGFMAIRGAGLIGATEKIGSGYSEAVVIDEAMYMLGKVSGAGYSFYPQYEIVSDAELREATKYEGAIKEGIVIILDEARLCDSDGGTIGTFERAGIPLAAASLMLYKVIASPNLY